VRSAFKAHYSFGLQLIWYLTVWDVEPFVTHQTSWLESRCILAYENMVLASDCLPHASYHSSASHSKMCWGGGGESDIPVATSSGRKELQSTTCRSDWPCASAILRTGAIPERVSQNSRLESSATLANSAELPG